MKVIFQTKGEIVYWIIIYFARNFLPHNTTITM
jgi:hypothetical protein